MYVQPDIKSSYEQNALGKTLYDLVLSHKPKKIIDFGTLGGYRPFQWLKLSDKTEVEQSMRMTYSITTSQPRSKEVLSAC